MSDRKLAVAFHGVEMSPSQEGVLAGGVPKTALNLIREMSGSNIDAILITNDRKYRESGLPQREFVIPRSRVELVLVKGGYSGIRYAAGYGHKVTMKICRLAKENQIDLIHGHSGRIGLSAITAASSKLAHVPSIHTLYCPVDNSHKSRLMLKCALRNVSRLVAISCNIQSSLIKADVPLSRIDVIPPMIDFSVYKQGCGGDSLRKALGIGDDFTIAYLGNLTSTKGIDMLLDSLGIVRKIIPNIKLLCGMELTQSGTKKRMGEIEAKIDRLNLRENIIQLGLVKNVERVLDAADVVVAPFNTSNVADYPLTVLEAMAVGTPVITTNAGGISEFITNRENGILVDLGNFAALGKEIEELEKDSVKIRDIGTRASISVRDRFPQDEITESYRRLYEEVIDGQESHGIL